VQLDVECDDGYTIMVNASTYNQSLGLTLIYIFILHCCFLVHMSLCSFSNLLARKFGLH